MEQHLEDLRQQLAYREHILQSKLTERSRQWETWSIPQRELFSLETGELRGEIQGLREQVTLAVSKQEEIRTRARSQPFGQRLFSKDETAEMHRKLSIPVRADDVSTRQGGQRGELVYLETHKAIEKAREVLGFNFAIEISGEPQILYRDVNASGKQLLCMKARVRVTLANGSFHEDVGVSSSHLSDPIEAVKIATKACVSDAIKRSLSHFGPALGSCLRDREFINEFIHEVRHQQKASSTQQSARKAQKMTTNFNAPSSNQPVPQPKPPLPMQQQQHRQQQHVAMPHSGNVQNSMPHSGNAQNPMPRSGNAQNPMPMQRNLLCAPGEVAPHSTGSLSEVSSDTPAHKEELLNIPSTSLHQRTTAPQQGLQVKENLPQKEGHEMRVAPLFKYDEAI